MHATAWICAMLSTAALFASERMNVSNDMLLVTVHPQKQSARGKVFKKPVTFTPGRVTRLAEALRTFGQPTETQVWSSKPAKDLGLDGSVYWWGEVGVSASPDGAITHVLVRKVIKRE